MALLNPKLTEKQCRFCHEYLVDYNATQAAIRSGYSKKTAHSTGCENLRKPNVKEYIHSLIKEEYDNLFVNREKLLKQLSNQAFADPADFYNDKFKLKDLETMTKEQRSAIHSIEVKEWKGGKEGRASSTTVTFRLYDKQKAIELIGKDLGLWKDNLNVKGEIAMPTPMKFNVEPPE